MKQISLAELEQQLYALHHIFAINMIPRNRTFSNLPNGRISSGLFYIVSGQCAFSWDGGEVQMTQGTLGYLPCGSVHMYRTLSESIRYIRLDFHMQEPESGEELIFTPHPAVLISQAPEQLVSSLNEITDTFQTFPPGAALKAQYQLHQLLYQVFWYCSSQQLNGPYRRILPGLRFLEEHLDQPVSSEQLARLCDLSATHFRRLFRQYAKTTPTEYHTQLRIRKACLLLKSSNYNITEIAELLGYDSIFYFSRSFKKIMGVSPKKYQTSYTI